MLRPTLFVIMPPRISLIFPPGHSALPVKVSSFLFACLSPSEPNNCVSIRSQLENNWQHSVRAFHTENPQSLMPRGKSSSSEQILNISLKILRLILVVNMLTYRKPKMPGKPVSFQRSLAILNRSFRMERETWSSQLIPKNGIIPVRKSFIK